MKEVSSYQRERQRRDKGFDFGEVRTERTESPDFAEEIAGCVEHGMRKYEGGSGLKSFWHFRTGWRGLCHGECKIIKIRENTIFLGQPGSWWGRVKFDEFRPDTFCTSEEFMEWCDAYTHEATELAEAVTSHWPDIGFGLTHYGDIILLENAWVEPYAPRGFWAEAVREIVEKQNPRYALIALLAYPLEYSGYAATPQLLRRRKAMFRHYGRLLNVQPFPAGVGQGGWMYRISPRLEGVVKPPKMRRRR